MILKKIAVLFLILAGMSFSALGQKNIYIEYQFENNYNYEQYKCVLVFSDTASVYKAFSGTNKGEKSEIKGDVVFVGGDLIDTYQYCSKQKDSLWSFDRVEDGVLKIREKIPVFNWNTDYKEQKRIGKYNCKKATTDFRGRSYVAWYCEEIPTSFGPWKFNGLPGLIFEVYDVTNTYKWNFAKVKATSETLEIPYNTFENVTIEEYVLRRTQRAERLRAKLLKVLPRGTEYNVPKNPRIGLETVYEWEEEK